MPFVVIVEHVPGKADLRESLRARHRVHLESAGGGGRSSEQVPSWTTTVRSLAGLSFSTSKPRLDVETEAEAEAVDAKDPYALNGLILSRRIHKWRLRWLFGEFVESDHTKY